MINFDIFFKRNGIRLPQHLMLPYTPVIDKFEFPVNSLHHYLVYDSVLNGPESSEYFYRNIDKKIYVEHLYDIAANANKGNPRKINVGSLLPWARQFHMKNKRFRQNDKAVEMVTDPYTLVVVNYGLIGSAYRYVRSMYAEYNKWWNLQVTLWQKVQSVATKTARNQFIFMDLPQTLPSVSQLDNFSARFSEATLRKLNGPNAWMILEIWKWLSLEYRNNSVIGDIPQESLEKINIVFKESGRFVVLNLGVINSWRYVKEDLRSASLTSVAPRANPVYKTNSEPVKVEQPATESICLTFTAEGFPVVVNPEATSLDSSAAMEAIADMISHQRVKITPRDLQKRFLKLMMTLMSIRTVSDIQVQDDDPEAPTEQTNTQQTVTIVDDDERSAVVVAQDMLNQLDNDLAALDEINKDTEEVEVGGIVKPLHSVNLKDFDLEVKPEEAIKTICDELADMGTMTAADYRRFLRLSENYKQIPSPDGTTTLDKFVSIDPEVLKIEKSYEFADIKTVVDKSMLKNSLIYFDEKYIKEVMQKDIASMVVSLQKGGFVINKYEVERIENIAGKMDIHTVRITPIEGLPSTLRFTMPVVDEDGTYTAGGVRYRMRKQRGDKPLRKTDFDRVAMTTYFGKTFVTRSDKKTNNYGQWLRDQVMSKGMDTSDDSINELFPADVFDNNFVAPRCYTSIAMGFKSFKSRGYDFIFDRESDKFNPDIASKYNKDQMVVCAVNEQGSHLVMDKNNVLYAVTENGLEPKGTFESFIGLDSSSAPVDFAQVKIYGKNIPVGMVLAYMFGLDNLLEKLKVTPRRVTAGQRLNLQDNEFAITFSDETLIFSKDDQLASMVFGGFKEFERAVKQYSVHTFDKPNVYLNVFESQGIGVRYLREIQMFNDLFVDPISKDLLVQDGLPASFPGMLIKATELLLRDDHPDTLDMAHMRIKGYERLAGAVYAEICQSVREHKTKSGRKHAQIELNPRSVWRRIREDPSVMVSSGINPVKNIKEREAVTYNGVGGRTSRSMVRSTRAYHKNDMGIISESTVDNSDVGINTFLSADPQFNSLRGTSRPYVVGKTGMTALLSTAAQLSVGSTNDD